MISLQSTLGKGLERVITRRLAYEAVERAVIPPNYVCATPKRSATDLILSLVDEIEDSLHNKKETVSLATFDVKGAFDAVTTNRMVRRLVDQGWPDKVCRWVQSFLTGRKADLTLDGQTGDTCRPWGALCPKARQYLLSGVTSRRNSNIAGFGVILVGFSHFLNPGCLGETNINEHNSRSTRISII